ncbi:MAG: hypothetical protein QOE77_3383 [Blastocatellia bacterium]|jgi:hypothetical protein|nr:hypothetical protein [Blastocatellia bacterium]
MPKVTPSKTEDRIKRLLAAWEDLADQKSFGGMTLDQCKAALAPSLTLRAQIEALQDQLTQAINQREAADDVSIAKMQLAVNGILADPTEGPDSSLYEAIGYTRKSERKTGLTRKKPGGGLSSTPKV